MINKEELQFIYLQEYIWIPIIGEFSFDFKLSYVQLDSLIDLSISNAIDIIRLDYYSDDLFVGYDTYADFNRSPNRYFDVNCTLNKLISQGITITQIHPTFSLKDQELEKYLLKDKEIQKDFCSHLADREKATRKLNELSSGVESQLNWFYSYFQWYVINKAKHSTANAKSVLNEAEMAIYSTIATNLNGNAEILHLIRKNIDSFIAQAEAEQSRISK